MENCTRLQETLGAVGVERQSPRSSGALQQTHERGTSLLGLPQDADTVRAGRRSCHHAG